MSTKRVLITGAASGIGRAVALRLAGAGASLALLDRDGEGLERIAAEAAGLGGTALTETADVTDAAATGQAVRRLWEAAGGLDISLQCAGILRTGRLGSDGSADHRDCMQVNYFGTLHVIEAVLPFMRQQGHGHLINMGSLAGLRGLPQMSAYAASKFAVYGLSQALRSELYGTAIAVSVVCPPVTRTPMVTDQSTLPPLFRRVPWLTPEQVAAAITDTMASRRFLVTVDLRSQGLLVLDRLLPWMVDRLVVAWDN